MCTENLSRMKAFSQKGLRQPTTDLKQTFKVEEYYNCMAERFHQLPAKFFTEIESYWERFVEKNQGEQLVHYNEMKKFFNNFVDIKDNLYSFISQDKNGSHIENLSIFIVQSLTISLLEPILD